MDFSLTTLFVLKNDGALEAKDSKREDLAPGEFGIYTSRYKAVVLSADASATPYIVFGQGRLETVPGLSNKYSDKIYKENLIEYGKAPAVDTATVQISTVGYEAAGETGNISVGCDETVSVTIRARSIYIDQAFAYGLTRTVTAKTPCCVDCADNCDKVDPVPVAQALADAINDNPELSKFVVAAVVSAEIGVVGDVPAHNVAGLTITGKALDTYGNPCDLTAFSHDYDKLTFQVWAYQGAATSQDSTDVFNRCDNIPTGVLQESSFIRGSADEIFEMEKQFNSYQTTMKHIFSNSAYNGGFVRYSEAGVFYTLYYIKFKSPHLDTWSNVTPIDETVYIAVPAGKETPLETFLKAYFGEQKLIFGTIA